jgi:hypothetical protein
LEAAAEAPAAAEAALEAAAAAALPAEAALAAEADLAAEAALEAALDADLAAEAALDACIEADLAALLRALLVRALIERDERRDLAILYITYRKKNIQMRIIDIYLNIFLLHKIQILSKFVLIFIFTLPNSTGGMPIHFILLFNIKNSPK